MTCRVASARRRGLEGGVRPCAGLTAPPPGAASPRSAITARSSAVSRHALCALVFSRAELTAQRGALVRVLSREQRQARTAPWGTHLLAEKGGWLTQKPDVLPRGQGACSLLRQNKGNSEEPRSSPQDEGSSRRCASREVVRMSSEAAALCNALVVCVHLEV